MMQVTDWPQRDKTDNKDTERGDAGTEEWNELHTIIKVADIPIVVH